MVNRLIAAQIAAQDLNKPKKDYSIIYYTGGGKISDWSKLTAAQKRDKLSKEWYIRLRLRNPHTGKLQDVADIKQGVNRYKTKKDRYKYLKKLEDNVISLIDRGVIKWKDEIKQASTTLYEVMQSTLQIKKREVSERGYKNLKSAVNRFTDYLRPHNDHLMPAMKLERRHVRDFLQFLSTQVSPRTVNNVRSDLSSVFSKAVENDQVSQNYFRDFKNKKARPKLNKAFTQDQISSIFKELKQKDFALYGYIAHIYYGLLRPATVVRLKVKDVDLKNRTFYTRTKTGDYIKQIPSKLIDDYYSKIDLSSYEGNAWLFSNLQHPRVYSTTELSRGNQLQKRFKRLILDNPDFDTEPDHTLYSFRHSAIGKLFTEKIKEYEGDPNAVETTLKFIQGITRHKSTDMVRNYLREIGYYRIDDWSDLMR